MIGTGQQSRHIIIRFKEGDWYCGHCGQSYQPADRPEPLFMYLAMLNAFIKAHEDCPAPEEPAK